MRQARDFDLLSIKEGSKHRKMSEIKQAVSGPESLYHAMATSPQQPL